MTFRFSRDSSPFTTADFNLKLAVRSGKNGVGGCAKHHNNVSVILCKRCCSSPAPPSLPLSLPPFAPLNTDQGSAQTPLSTASCLLPDQKSLECVNALISTCNTLFSSCQPLCRDKEQPRLLPRRSQLLPARRKLSRNWQRRLKRRERAGEPSGVFNF